MDNRCFTSGVLAGAYMHSHAWRWKSNAGTRRKYCCVIDTKFLPGVMWRGTWDPESILTTVTAVASGLTGMLAGRLMISNYPANEK